MNLDNHKSVAFNSSMLLLILIAIFCTFGTSLLNAEVAESHETHRLQSSESNSNSSNFLYKQKYFLIEDDSVQEQLETFNDLPKFVSHQVLDCTSPSFYSKSFFDSINSFHYNSTFGFYPLRSPPLFS